MLCPEKMKCLSLQKPQVCTQKELKNKSKEIRINLEYIWRKMTQCPNVREKIRPYYPVLIGSRCLRGVRASSPQSLMESLQ